MTQSTLTAKPDLDRCDQEPIHVPGSIQGHGVLLAYDPVSGRISHVSANAERLFKTSVARIIDSPIATLLGAKTAISLAASHTGESRTTAAV